ncbi:MAG: T9SS type A sorting domain-containing protein [Candidatus Kapabacteria bacterium]|nr:T9SS type A sorting domain-containing protein [Candidatus Kapabacteria bacterium]
MNTQQHEPLLRDEDILALLTPQAAIVPQQETPRPLLQSPMVYISGAALVAASIATVYLMNTTTPVVEQNALLPTVDDVVQQGPVISTDESLRKVQSEKVQPLVTTITASKEELAQLGITLELDKASFVEDGNRVTISSRGIGLRPTTDAALDRTPIAVTLYDQEGAYASWYNPEQGDPAMNDLVPVRIALQSTTSDLHQNVIALLWFAPTEGKIIEQQITSYQEHRDAASGVRIENVFPNPAAGNESTVLISANASTLATVTLMDISGKVLATVSENQRIERGTTTIMLTDLQSLPSGMVLVVIDMPEIGVRLVQRLLIQR